MVLSAGTPASSATSPTAILNSYYVFGLPIHPLLIHVENKCWGTRRSYRKDQGGMVILR